MRKHYPFIFSLNAVPALLRYPKLFARYSLRTILTATPTHTPCFRHRRRSCSLPSSKRGTPPLQLFLISKFIRSLAKLYNQQRSSEICHLPFPICHSARPWHLASTFRTSHFAFRTSFAISHLQFAIFLNSLILKNSIISTAFEFVLFVIKVKSCVAAVGDSKGKFTFVALACVFPA